MSNPFAVNPSGTVIPGQGPGIAQGLAGVLAQMQIQKENEFRQQELQTAMAQQQALQQYYQQQAMAEQQRIGLAAGEQALQREGNAQVGAAQRAYLADPNRGLMSQILQDGAAQMPPMSSLPSIFTGVSNQNMPAAIKGVGEAQGLMPTPPKMPEPATSQKEYEYYNYLQRMDPQRAAQYKALFLDPHPSTQINIGDKGETEFSKKIAEARVGTLTESSKQAQSAIGGFAALSEAYDRADKALTGLTAKPALGIARALSAMGVAPAKDVVQNTQTFQKLAGEGALIYLRSRDLGSGTAVSDADREFVLNLAGGNIGLDKGSIKRVLRVNVGAGIMKATDGIQDLKEQAITYPSEAPSLLRDADRLQAKLQPMWARYAQMLAQEGMGEGQIREKLIRGGVTDPEQIIRNLPKVGSQGIIDNLFPQRVR